jgi:hypothetical protein
MASRKAVSPDNSANVDIYTFVQNQETAGADSEHCYSANSNSHDSNVRVQSATIVQQTTRNFVAKEVVLPMHARHPAPYASNYNYPYRHPTPQIYFSDSSPQSQGRESYVSTQRALDTPAVAACGTSPLQSFSQMTDTTLEGYQTTREEEHGKTYAMDSMTTAMEIDDINMWWNQSSENCETEPFGLLEGVFSWNQPGGYFVDSDR